MSKIKILFMLFAVLMSACKEVDEVPITDWVHHADFPGTPRASATSFVLGNKAYVCCGRTEENSNPLNEVWQFDSNTATWTQLDTFPGRPRVKAIGVSINGIAYVGLGSTGAHTPDSVFKDFYAFDPATGVWTPKASFPGLAANSLTYGVVNGCLYTSLGFTGVVQTKDTYKYDPISDTWTKLADFPSSYFATASFSIGNDFYVAGGYQGRNIRSMFRFDTVNNSWTNAPSLPEGRMLSNGLELAGKGYVMLGRYWAGTESGGRLLSDVVEYDPNENKWTRRGDFPGGARQNAMVFTIADRAYIVMGENDSERLGDVWSFKP